LNIDTNADEFRELVAALGRAALTNTHSFLPVPRSLEDEITQMLRVPPVAFTEALDSTQTAVGIAFVLNFPDKEPPTRGAGQAMHVNPLGFLGRAECNIRGWPRSEDQDPKGWWRNNAGKHLLEELGRDIAHGMNKSLCKLLTTAAESHGIVIEGPNLKEEVLAMGRDDWWLLFNGVIGTGDLVSMRLMRTGHYIPKQTGLLIAPASELGYWYAPANSGELTAWADPRNLEMGITGFLGRGAAIKDASKVITVRFGGL
jgi:hypothetical protein